MVKVTRLVQRTRPLEAAAHGCESERGYLPDRFGHDRLRHLRTAGFPVDEGDGNLPDAEACAQRSICRLDLERISLRVDRAEVDRLENPASVALEASGEVAHRRTQHDACIPRSTRGHEAPQRAPVAHGAAAHVARPE